MAANDSEGLNSGGWEERDANHNQQERNSLVEEHTISILGVGEYVVVRASGVVGKTDAAEAEYQVESPSRNLREQTGSKLTAEGQERMKSHSLQRNIRPSRTTGEQTRSSSRARQHEHGPQLL